VAYVDSEYKAVFPTDAAGVRFGQEVTTKQDQPVADRNVFFRARKERLVQVMREMSRFAAGKSAGKSAAPTTTAKPFSSERAVHKHTDPLHLKTIN